MLFKTFNCSVVQRTVQNTKFNNSLKLNELNARHYFIFKELLNNKVLNFNRRFRIFAIQHLTI